jgi:hypothetical protein
MFELKGGATYKKKYHRLMKFNKKKSVKKETKLKLNLPEIKEVKEVKENQDIEIYDKPIPKRYSRKKTFNA